MAQIIRNMVADYLNIGTKNNPVWGRCSVGFTTLDESPNPQLNSVVYIHEKAASPHVTRYERAFAFETELWNDQAAINLIRSIAYNDKVGQNAVIQYLRTDYLAEEDGTPITTEVAARLFDVTVEVTDSETGAGGEVVTMSGNLNQVGDTKFGTFNLATKIWDEGGEVDAQTAKTLTVTVAAGQEIGKIKVTVTPAISVNNSYLYKVSATAFSSGALPDYNDYISEGWTAWDGSDEITATDTSYIAIAEVSGDNLVKGIGSGQATSS